MRCADVIRELSAPSAGRDAEALARHVADCPGCAATAGEIRRFDAAWDATRPVEPPVETWHGLWSQVVDRFQASPAVLPLSNAPRRRWLVPGLVATVVAQAAAAALAIGWLLEHRGGAIPVAAAVPAGTGQSMVFDLEPGQTLILELDERGERVVCRPRFLDTSELGAFNGDDGSDLDPLASQGDMLVLNVMEGME